MNKENFTRAMTVMLQPSLCDRFEHMCRTQNRTTSEVVCELIANKCDTHQSLQSDLIDPTQPVWGRQGVWCFPKSEDGINIPLSDKTN